MAGVTNRGKKLILSHVFRGAPNGSSSVLPANFYVFLVSDTPTSDTEDMAELTEVNVAGNETVLPPGAVSFDTTSEDQAANSGTIKVKDCAFNGPITAATHAVLLDSNSTPSAANVWAFWSLGGAHTVSSGQTLTLQDLQIDLLES